MRTSSIFVLVVTLNSLRTWVRTAFNWSVAYSAQCRGDHKLPQTPPGSKSLDVVLTLLAKADPVISHQEVKIQAMARSESWDWQIGW